MQHTDKNLIRLNDGKFHQVQKKGDGVYIDGVKIDLSTFKN